MPGNPSRMDNHRHQPGSIRRMLARSVRGVVHTPLGISMMSVTRLLYPHGRNDWVELSQVSLALPRLAPEFDNYKIVHLSDFHIGTWLKREQLAQAVDLVNQQRPDLVAITGDFVTYTPERFFDDLTGELRRLVTHDGVLAVLGNHDHWSNPQVVRQILQTASVIELQNSVLTLKRGDASLHIAGIDDFMESMDRLDQVLEQLPGDGAAILLAHEPDFALISAASGRFDLQISGHSHGGQVVFPGLGALILPSYAREFPSGLYHFNGMLVYTNRGLGTSEIQVRFRCPPEITVFTLKSAIQNNQADSL